MSLTEIFRRNVRARIDALHVSPYLAACRSGKAPSYFTGVLNEKRNRTKICTAMLEEVGEALNVPPWELLRDGFDPRMYARPEWSVDMPRRRIT